MPDAALPLVRGTLDVLVLKALSWAPMHGFQITCWLRSAPRRRSTSRTGRSTTRSTGSRREGSSEPNGGSRRTTVARGYYALTPAGRAHLVAESERLLRYSRAVVGILTVAPRAS
jgi:hypothetical protein